MTDDDALVLRGAAIDIGSNSVHLLVGEIVAGGVLPIHDESELLGLGDALDRTGHLAPDARARLAETSARYVAVARSHGADAITLMGTEPLRRTADRDLVCHELLLATGLELHVLRHEDEALLTLLGVTGGAPPQRPLLVVDIGGGSSEYVLAEAGMLPVAGGISTGSARLTSAIVTHDPPTAPEVDALRSAAAASVATTPAGAPEDGVMVGGSATNLVKLTPGGVAIGRLATADLGPLYGVLTELSGEQVAARYLVNRRRAGMLAAGAAIAEAFMLHHGLGEVSISHASLREGAIIARSRAGPAWVDRLADLAVTAS